MEGFRILDFHDRDQLENNLSFPHWMLVIPDRHTGREKEYSVELHKVGEKVEITTENHFKAHFELKIKKESLFLEGNYSIENGEFKGLITFVPQSAEEYKGSPSGPAAVHDWKLLYRSSSRDNNSGS